MPKRQRKFTRKEKRERFKTIDDWLKYKREEEKRRKKTCQDFKQ